MVLEMMVSAISLGLDLIAYLIGFVFFAAHRISTANIPVYLVKTHVLLFNQYLLYTYFWITVNSLLNKDYDQKI